MPLLSPATCAAIIAYGSNITNNMLCVGYVQSCKESCQGDSGGPLVVPKNSGSYAWAGVVSWSNQCSLANNPSVYTRVADYISLLKRQTGTNLASTIFWCRGTCKVSPVVGGNHHTQGDCSIVSTFKEWRGACSAAGMVSTCKVTLDQVKELTASLIDTRKISEVVTILAMLLED